MGIRAVANIDRVGVLRHSQLSEFPPFIVIGITTGAVYGLAGVRLVLTYKTSGIFNFAYGAVAALAVFVFYWLHTEHGMPWPFAAAATIFTLISMRATRRSSSETIRSSAREECNHAGAPNDQPKCMGVSADDPRRGLTRRDCERLRLSSVAQVAEPYPEGVMQAPEPRCQA